MTTAIAAIATGRSCTVLEPDAVCFRLAMDRLRSYAALHTQSSGVSRRTRSHSNNGFPTESKLLSLLQECNNETAMSDEDENERDVDRQDENVLQPDPANEEPLVDSRQEANAELDETEKATMEDTFKEVPEDDFGPITELDYPVAEVDCHVVPCILRRDFGDREKAQATQHNCSNCNAAVHPLCCLRVLKIPSNDKTTPLFCTQCRSS